MNKIAKINTKQGDFSFINGYFIHIIYFWEFFGSEIICVLYSCKLSSVKYIMFQERTENVKLNIKPNIKNLI